MTDRKFIKVKVYKTKTGRQCMHCGRPAVVKGVDATGKFRHEVRYCEEHAVEMGALAPGEEVNA